MIVTSYNENLILILKFFKFYLVILPQKFLKFFYERALNSLLNDTVRLRTNLDRTGREQEHE